MTDKHKSENTTQKPAYKEPSDLEVISAAITAMKDFTFTIRREEHAFDGQQKVSVWAEFQDPRFCEGGLLFHFENGKLITLHARALHIDGDRRWDLPLTKAGIPV